MDLYGAPFGAAPGTITVTLDPTGLPSGQHTGSVVVSAFGAAGSPATIPVTFTIDQPCNTISPPLNPDETRQGVLNSQDCQAPHRPGSFANIYTLTANAGDTLSFRLTSDGFDAYLILTDEAGTVLAENDECPSETRTACITEFAVRASGRFFVEATSAGPGESGNLAMTVVRERPPVPPQAIGQFRKDGVTSIGIGATTPEDGVVIKERSRPNRSDAVQLEIEIEPLGIHSSTYRRMQSAFVPVPSGNVHSLLRRTV